MCGAFERVVSRTLSSSVSNQRGSSCWRCFTLAEIPLSGSAAPDINFELQPDEIVMARPAARQYAAIQKERC